MSMKMRKIAFDAKPNNPSEDDESRELEELDPSCEPAKIRAFFVHPQWSRRGIGKTILHHCESDAQSHGFQSLEMMATLPGQKMYQVFGYIVSERVLYKMDDGVTIEFVRMDKNIQ